MDNKECDIPSDLLKIVLDCYRQCDRAKGVYFRSSKPNEWSVGWN